MKYCPTCETKYDEDILRFCMKDGTPLVDADEPNFIQMPSESLRHDEDDDPAEVTVVRRNKPASNIPPPIPPADDITDHSTAGSGASHSGAQRIVVPTTEQRDTQRNREARAYSAPPPKQNTAKIVLLTVFLTLAVLALGAFGFWAIQSLVTSGNENTNINTNANFGNENTNVNTNLGSDANFDFNTNSIFDPDSNTNSATPTPSPSPSPTASPTPRPSPSLTPSPTPDDDDDQDDPQQQPTQTQVPSQTPRRTPTPLIIRPDSPARTPSQTNSGVLNSRAVTLPKPVYPEAAKRMRISGQVSVRVSVDDNGNVVSAKAMSGPPLLRSAAENAARRAKLRGNAQATTGTLIYNFTNN